MTMIIDGSAGATFPDSSVQASAFSQGPAFRAYRTASQTLTSGVWAKLQCTIEDFDTANAYDNATNYRFQPLVAGYYLINVSGYGGGSTNTTSFFASLYKNGTQVLPVASSGIQTLSSAAGSLGCSYSDVIYLNGSTDYVECWVYAQGSGTLTAIGAISGVLVRAA